MKAAAIPMMVLLAVSAGALVSGAHYVGVGAHEAMHCLLGTEGDVCHVKIYRAPAAADGGVMGSTRTDGPSPPLEHAAIYVIGWAVSALFMAPALIAAWYIGRWLK